MIDVVNLALDVAATSANALGVDIERCEILRELR
jgi:hypothetical protein